jgi:hypothetical protein
VEDEFVEELDNNEGEGRKVRRQSEPLAEYPHLRLPRRQDSQRNCTIISSVSGGDSRICSAMSYEDIARPSSPAFLVPVTRPDKPRTHPRLGQN